jgi:hypothetical protein
VFVKPAPWVLELLVAAIGDPTTVLDRERRQSSLLYREHRWLVVEQWSLSVPEPQAPSALEQRALYALEPGALSQFEQGGLLVYYEPRLRCLNRECCWWWVLVVQPW